MFKLPKIKKKQDEYIPIEIDSFLNALSNKYIITYSFYLYRNVNIMEGVLWKWTNYWSGWQMRWFVLDNGVLSYYKSQEEVNQGCKGSLKVSACEIIVHPTDHTRLEIAIPGEQHIYLKAPSKQERQQWLVALGSSKACMTTKNRKDMGSGNGDTLKSKKSQLRLYCDLLMQQVHQVKTCTNDKNGIDANKLNEATSLLTITCDTFIETLEECMKLADANFLYDLSVNHPSGNALPQGYHQKVKPTVPVMKRSSSYESSDIKPSEKKDKLTT